MNAETYLDRKAGVERVAPQAVCEVLNEDPRPLIGMLREMADALERGHWQRIGGGLMINRTCMITGRDEVSVNANLRFSAKP